jgi:hypothetical protein
MGICIARGITDNALSIVRTAMSDAQRAMTFTHNAMTRHAHDVLQRDRCSMTVHDCTGIALHILQRNLQ